MKQILTNIARVCLFIPAIVLLIISCSDNPISSEVKSNGISFSSEQISWIPWKPEYLEKKNSLNRVFVGRWISAATGGRVGGWYTFYNTVTIPAGALLQDTYISVEVLRSWWCFVQTGGGVEFLPSMQFQSPVTVSLSYEYLDYYNDLDNLAIYWTNDGGNNWYIIDGITYNTNLEIALFEVDHFTVFAWGEEPPGGE